MDAGKTARNESRKRLHHRLDAKLTHTGEDLVLQRDLVCMPLLGKIAVNTADVTHTIPGHVRRTAGVLINFGLGEAELQPHALGYCFSGSRSHEHVETMHGLPVELLFPAFPCPIWKGISRSDHIVGVAYFERRSQTGDRCSRPFIRKGQPGTAPRNLPHVFGTGIIVEPAAKGDGAGRAKCKNSVCRRVFVCIPASDGRDEFHADVFGLPLCDTIEHIACGLISRHIGGCGIHRSCRSQGKCGKQKDTASY